MWSQSALGRMDMGKMASADPTLLLKAQKDPQFWKAIKEISDNPTSTEVRLLSPSQGHLLTCNPPCGPFCFRSCKSGWKIQISGLSSEKCGSK